MSRPVLTLLLLVACGPAPMPGSGGGGGTGATGGGGTGTGGGGTTMVPAPRGCLTDVTAGHHKFSACDTIDYDVEIPPACASGGCGIIFDVHGLTMNADAEDR